MFFSFSPVLKVIFIVSDFSCSVDFTAKNASMEPDTIVFVNEGCKKGCMEYKRYLLENAYDRIVKLGIFTRRSPRDCHLLSANAEIRSKI